ncbi:MAG: hypothetical protein PVF57_05430 [Pseudomonadales bacterium]|jgi:hypothetical protein
MNRVLIHLLIGALLLPQTSYGLNRGRMDQVVSELAAFRDAAAGEYAAETLLDRADYEADGIIAFVRSGVRFQPYAGVLRGPAGTLRSLAGNAHDQAVTLASLLNDAGFEAQVVHGTLSESQARQLLAEFRPGDAQPHPDTATPPDFVQKMAEAVRAHATDTTKLQAEVSDYATRLWRQSEASRFVSSTADVQRSLIEEARDYRWVRYRDGAGDPWRDVHPVFATEPDDWQLSVEGVEAGTVPAEALQRVTVQFFMRRDASGGVVETVPLSDKLTFTAANLTDAPITFEIGSDASASRAPDQTIDRVVAESFLFYPLVNGGVPAGLKVFDLNGRTYSAATLEGLNSVFETLGRAMDSANARLAELGGSSGDKATPEGKTALQSVWVELGHESPMEGTSHHVERELYSRDNERAAAAQLLQRWTIDVATASPISAYYDATLADLGVQALEGYRQYLDYLARNPKMTDIQKLRAYSHFVPSEDRSRLLQLRRAFDGFTSSGVENYAHVPQILALRHGFARGDDGWKAYEVVDILSNARRSLRAGDLPEPDPGVGFVRGVWETRMETVGRSAAWPVATFNAFTHLEAGSDWSPSSQDGEIVLNPGNASEAKAWWALDPATGSAIGMLETPWGVAGADAVETVVTVILIGLSALISSTSAYSCSKQAGNSVECCISANVLLFIYGVVFSLCAGLIGLAMVGAEAGVAASVITGTAADITGLGIPYDCSAT